MVAELKYRCVNDGCGREFPRAVAYCPYCGRRQDAAPARAAREEPPSAALAPVERPVPPRAVAAPPAAAGAVPGAVGRAPPQAGGAAGNRRSGPPPRQTIGKGTWLIVALMLVTIWIVAKPTSPGRKLEARTETAIALALDCQIADARAELSSLKSARASAAQLKRLQDAIGANAGLCERKQQRARAWTDARPAIDGALGAGLLDRAATRLGAFSKRWGEDADTRAWRGRIDAKRAERLLDEADACLSRADRACLEGKLLAAEKLQRPELARRAQALRDALSRLLEATLLEQAPPARHAPAPITTQ